MTQYGKGNDIDCKWIEDLEGRLDIPDGIPAKWWEAVNKYCQNYNCRDNNEWGCNDNECKLSNVTRTYDDNGVTKPWCAKKVQGAYVNATQPGCQAVVQQTEALDLYEQALEGVDDDDLVEQGQMLNLIANARMDMTSCNMAKVWGGSWREFDTTQPECNQINQFCVQSNINIENNYLEGVQNAFDMSCDQNVEINVGGGSTSIPPQNPEVPLDDDDDDEKEPLPVWAIIALILVGIVVLFVVISSVSGGGGGAVMTYNNGGGGYNNNY